MAGRSAAVSVGSASWRPEIPAPPAEPRPSMAAGTPFLARASLFAFDALEEKAREHGLVALIQIGQPVVDIEFTAAVAQGGEIVLQRLLVGVADHRRVRDHVHA